MKRSKNSAMLLKNSLISSASEWKKEMSFFLDNDHYEGAFEAAEGEAPGLLASNPIPGVPSWIRCLPDESQIGLSTKSYEWRFAPARR